MASATWDKVHVGSHAAPKCTHKSAQLNGGVPIAVTGKRSQMVSRAYQYQVTRVDLAGGGIDGALVPD